MRYPIPRLIASFSVLARLAPRYFLGFLFGKWPSEQIDILMTLIRSPSVILSALTMANDEMLSILELDIATLSKNEKRLCVFYTHTDQWDGGRREEIGEMLGDHLGLAHVIYGPGVPHAFSISKSLSNFLSYVNSQV